MKDRWKRAGALLLAVIMLAGTWTEPAAAAEPAESYSAAAENGAHSEQDNIKKDDIRENDSDPIQGEDDKQDVQDEKTEDQKTEDQKNENIIVDDSDKNGETTGNSNTEKPDGAQISDGQSFNIEEKDYPAATKAPAAPQSASAISGELKSSKGTSVYVDRGVTFTVSCTGGDGNYEYQFTEVYNGEEKIVQEYSEKNTYDLHTGGAGTYTYYADVRDKSGNSLRLTYTMTVNVHPDYRLKGTLTSSRSGDVYTDRGVALTAGSTGGYGKVEYQFTEVYNGKQTIVQEYGTENVYEFRTSGPGLHTYYVDIKDEKGQNVRASCTVMVVQDPAYILKGTLTSGRSGDVYTDRGVVLTAGSTGGYGTVEYQFTEVYNGKQTIVQEYGTENVYEFRTSGPGLHTYYVDIKDEKGQSVRASCTVMVVQDPAYILKGTFTSSRSGNVYVDRGVALTAKSTGGYGTVEYQFTEVYNGKQTVVQKYGTENVYEFRTSGPGLHTYYVDIKDEEGQSVRLSCTVMVVVHPDYVLKGSLGWNRGGNVYVDRGVALTAGNTGGYGTVKYRFTEVYNGKQTVVQEYGTENVYEFRSTGPGPHTYYVDIKDEEGQSVRLSCTVMVVVHPDYVLKGSLSCNRAGSVYVQRGVILTAASTGGYGGTQYQFTDLYGRTQTVVQEYSSNPIYEFQSTKPGVHIFYVDIRDNQGQTIRLQYNLQITVHPDYKLSGTLKANVGSIVNENQAITLTASAKGGYGSKKLYQFRESYNGKINMLQLYAEANTYSFKIKGTGQHIYYVDIKDEEGQVVTLSVNISIGKNGWFYEGGYKFYYRDGVKQLDLDGILPKQSSYYIKVNRQACTVTVYAKDGNNGYIIPVKRFACSVGKASTPTPTGTYYTSDKYRWHTLMGPSYGQYCTRIVGGVLFHSVAGRNMTSYNLNARDYNMLGSPASHGCVRLCVRDAKWIYDNCKSGTMVTIYDSANPGPLGKPATIKIPAGQTWDPTDPNL